MTPTDIKSKQRRILAENVSKNFPVETNDVNEVPHCKITLPSIGSSNLNDHYSMSTDPNGICHIINNHFFKEVESQDGNLLKSRIGTVKDAFELKNTFSWLNFEIFIHNDIKADDILEIIKSPQEMPIDCFVCCILSHGFYDGVYGSDGKKVTFDEMQAAINGNSAPWLIGKPKLFFIQACQGDDKQKDALLCKDSSVRNSRAEETPNNDWGDWNSLAEGADFCVSIATTPGIYSFMLTKRVSNNFVYIKNL